MVRSVRRGGCVVIAREPAEPGAPGNMTRMGRMAKPQRVPHRERCSSGRGRFARGKSRAPVAEVVVVPQDGLRSVVEV